jgi:hypothetical protein
MVLESVHMQGSCGIRVAAGASIPAAIIPVAMRMAQRLEDAGARRAAVFQAMRVQSPHQVNLLLKRSSRRVLKA